MPNAAGLTTDSTKSCELTPEWFKEQREAFLSDKTSMLARNVCNRLDVFEIIENKEQGRDRPNVFNNMVSKEIKPVTNQKSSGRCWMFALLNAMRVPFCRNLNLEEFEFSQNYLFYWDKIERSNYFLTKMIELAKQKEPSDSRVVQFLLQDVVSDGGQWDMLVNLVEKYGVVPKMFFTEAPSSENSRRFNTLLRTMLRGFACKLYGFVEEGLAQSILDKKKMEMMAEVYKVVTISLGIPPETIQWEYLDKEKKYQCFGEMTPKEFYDRHVREHFDVQNKICLVNDPRPSCPYSQLYTVQYLGNVVEGRLTLYNNQPMEVLKKAIIESIKRNEVVWFGVDFTPFRSPSQGLLDLHAVDYSFATDIPFPILSKSGRLLWGMSCMNHAMAITGVHVNDDNCPVRYRIENSHGDDSGLKGYLQMTDEWFNEFGFEVVVDKAVLSQEVLDVMKQVPMVLPPWDPMGSLACTHCCTD